MKGKGKKKVTFLYSIARKRDEKEIKTHLFIAGGEASKVNLSIWSITEH